MPLYPIDEYSDTASALLFRLLTHNDNSSGSEMALVEFTGLIFPSEELFDFASFPPFSKFSGFDKFYGVGFLTLSDVLSERVYAFY